MSFDIGKTIPCDHVDRYGNTYHSPERINLCPKCAGSNEYYDFVWSVVSGDVELVEDNPLLQELCVKAVITAKGDNIFHPSYGTSIVDSVGAPSSSIEAVARLVEREIVKGIGAVRFRQDQQLELGQEMSDDELLHSLDGIEIGIADERTLSVTLRIIAESGRSLVFTI